jgi:hypothetical protein
VALASWRYFVSLALLIILPVYLSADDLAAASAVLRSNGGVLVNGSTAPSSIAVFSGDVIENRSESTAWVEYQGSSVEINRETVITLGNGEILLDHGIVTVTTFRQFRVRAGCVVAAPVAVDKTVYLVKDTDSRVTVHAQEKDVNLDSNFGHLKRASQSESSGHEIVHQNEQKSREEHCGTGDLRNSAEGPLLNSPYAVATGAGVISVGILCILLCFSNKPPSPCSPSDSSTACTHP